MSEVQHSQTVQAQEEYLSELEKKYPAIKGAWPKKGEAVSNYQRLAAINVNDKTEKKGKLTYLSWTWAVDQLLRLDPQATWEYKDPVYFNETLMVFCSVTALEKTMTAQLPVMDHHNKAIKHPDAFAVNTAMQRCLAKAIALHGLGLYIYAGEDLPPDENSHPEAETDQQRWTRFAGELVQIQEEGSTMQAVKVWYENEDVKTSNEAREFLWSQLKDYSTLRTAIRNNKPEVKEVK